MPKFLAALTAHLDLALMLAGAVALVTGAGQVYAPAGWIVGGLLALAAGWRLAT